MSILDKFKLTGKTALVTGCKRGIGKAIAVGLAEAGADIIGVSATLEPGGSEVEKEVRALGRSFKGYAADFSKRPSLYAFIGQVKRDFPQIDILFNNAGTIMRKPAAEHPDEYWDAVIETNLNAQFIMTREIGKDMVARGSGKIIFTASLLTFQGGITVPGYAASKGAIVALTRALAVELAGDRIRVNCVAPGPIATSAFWQNNAPDSEYTRNLVASIPLKRMGTPEDVANAVAFFCSDEASFVTGQTLFVCGGVTVG